MFSRGLRQCSVRRDSLGFRKIFFGLDIVRKLEVCGSSGSIKLNSEFN